MYINCKLIFAWVSAYPHWSSQGGASLMTFFEFQLAWLGWQFAQSGECKSCHNPTVAPPARINPAAFHSYFKFLQKTLEKTVIFSSAMHICIAVHCCIPVWSLAFCHKFMFRRNTRPNIGCELCNNIRSFEQEKADFKQYHTENIDIE